MSRIDDILEISRELSKSVDGLKFAEPVASVYNPLDYAWEPYEQYIKKYAKSLKKVLFMGMNPGPFGMAQTGLPFGEVAAIRDWVKVQAPVHKPKSEHEKRPVDGFDCKRSEVSGKRLWGLFAEKFKDPEVFFNEHFVLNYCPLLFIEEGGKNRTPDKLPKEEVNKLYEACDDFLRGLVRLLEPEWVIGVGAFAEGRAQEALSETGVKIGRILHPSPASPASNKDWGGKVTAQLQELGVWP